MTRTISLTALAVLLAALAACSAPKKDGDAMSMSASSSDAMAPMAGGDSMAMSSSSDAMAPAMSSGAMSSGGAMSH